MSESELSYQEQVDLLYRATRNPDVFRFIIIQYDIYSRINALEHYLHFEYPDRPTLRLSIRHTDYNSLIEKLTNHRGFVFIEDFNRLLDNPAIYHGFNQRRDKITALPIQLLCFLPQGANYLHDCMEKIRDWWSVRNLLLNIKSSEPRKATEKFAETAPVSSLGGYDVAGKREELKRLLHRLGELRQDISATELRQSLYFQALEILYDLGEYQRGLDFAKQWCLEAEAAGWDGHNKWVIYNSLGRFHESLGQFDKAINYFELALRFVQEEEISIGLTTVQNNLATAYRSIGRYEESAQILETVLKSSIANYGEMHPIVAIQRSNLAAVYSEMKRHKEASQLLEIALASDIANYGEMHPNVSIRKSMLSNEYSAMGRLEEAVNLQEAALASDLSNFGESHPRVSSRKSNLANIYNAMGRSTEAITLLESALASDIASFGESHPSIATRYNNLAHVYLGIGQYQQALEYFQKALTILKNSFGEKHPYIDITIESILTTISKGAAAGDPDMLALQAAI